MIAVVVMTDGRRCIEQSIESMGMLDGPVSLRLINDDSGDPAHHAWLQERFGPLGFYVIPAAGERQGFGGAIRHTWSYLRACTTEPFLFITEDDFVYERPVDLTAMALLLNANQHLVQLVLRRQAWNAEERAAGGIIEQHPGDYIEIGDEQGRWWIEHRRFFSTNPYLARRELLRHGWPTGPESEGHFTHHVLVTSRRARFAFWGRKHDAPWVTHIGHERVGSGY